MTHCWCALGICSAGGAKSIILSAGGAESIILSAGGAESMMLSACAESMIVSAPPPESMILAGLFDCVITLTFYLPAAWWGAAKTKLIGNYDDCWFMTIVNSASTVAPIGLPPKMAKFLHTSNRLLVGHWCCRALSPLYFNSSAVGDWLLVVGHWSLVGPQ